MARIIHLMLMAISERIRRAENCSAESFGCIRRQLRLSRHSEAQFCATLASHLDFSIWWRIGWRFRADFQSTIRALKNHDCTGPVQKDSVIVTSVLCPVSAVCSNNVLRKFTASVVVNVTDSCDQIFPQCKQRICI